MSESKYGMENTRERGIVREDPLAPWYNYDDRQSTSTQGDVDHWLHRQQDNVQFSPRKLNRPKPGSQRM